MPRSAHPTEADVREAAQQLLADQRAGGSYPSVSTLARRFNINRTTFYRHYSAITDAMLNAAAGQQTPSIAERRSSKTRDDERDNTFVACAAKTATCDATSKSTKNTSED